VGTLGDSFPEDFKKDFAKRNVKEGSVIRCFVRDTNPPKEKRFIILAFSYDKITLGTLYINSEINPNLFNTEELKKLHLLFSAKDREYLHHDSFVDCSEIYQKPVTEILKVLEEHPKSLIGEVNVEDFKKIRTTIKSAKTISIATKKKFGVFL